MLQPGVCTCGDLGNTGLFGINVTPKDGSRAGGQNAVTITPVSGPGRAVAASGWSSSISLLALFYNGCVTALQTSGRRDGVYVIATT